jgi:hypothetical protein
MRLVVIYYVFCCPLVNSALRGEKHAVFSVSLREWLGGNNRINELCHIYLRVLSSSEQF